LADWEIAWVNRHKELPDHPVGNSVELAQQMFAKYQPLLDEVYTGVEPGMTSSHGDTNEHLGED
jgi:hypothetical protein